MKPIRIAEITPCFKRISSKTTWSFMRVTADCGTVGWGEATVNGKARETLAACHALAAHLVGQAPDMDLAVIPPQPSKVGWGVASAIDQALWDIAAKREGKALAALLGGGGGRDRVEMYANINRGTLTRQPESFAASADAAASAGFTAIKIAPFDDLTPELAPTHEGFALIRAGLDRIAAAHAAIAGRARLMVDCHWRFTPATAAETLREATRIGIAWFECPLPETEEMIPEVRRLRGIANAGGVQLAGMEESSTLEGFLPWVEAYDVLMPDVKYAGGLRELWRIADTLRQHGVGFSLHNPTGSVCHATSLHVTAAMSQGLPLEMQWAETDLLYNLPIATLPRPDLGWSAIPSGNGHGAALDLADLEDKPC